MGMLWTVRIRDMMCVGQWLVWVAGACFCCNSVEVGCQKEFLGKFQNPLPRKKVSYQLSCWGEFRPITFQ